METESIMVPRAMTRVRNNAFTEQQDSKERVTISIAVYYTKAYR
jgi:hypothetical protein